MSSKQRASERNRLSALDLGRVEMWEYHNVVFDVKDVFTIVEKFNILGKENWQLVSCTSFDGWDHNGITNVLATFKRQIKPG